MHAVGEDGDQTVGHARPPFRQPEEQLSRHPQDRAPSLRDGVRRPALPIQQGELSEEPTRLDRRDRTLVRGARPLHDTDPSARNHEQVGTGVAPAEEDRAVVRMFDGCQAPELALLLVGEAHEQLASRPGPQYFGDVRACQEPFTPVLEARQAGRAVFQVRGGPGPRRLGVGEPAEGGRCERLDPRRPPSDGPGGASRRRFDRRRGLLQGALPPALDGGGQRQRVAPPRRVQGRLASFPVEDAAAGRGQMRGVLVGLGQEDLDLSCLQDVGDSLLGQLPALPQQRVPPFLVAAATGREGQPHQDARPVEVGPKRSAQRGQLGRFPLDLVERPRLEPRQEPEGSGGQLEARGGDHLRDAHALIDVREGGADVPELHPK